MGLPVRRVREIYKRAVARMQRGGGGGVSQNLTTTS
jgi:hypothetical protein